MKLLRILQENKFQVQIPYTTEDYFSRPRLVVDSVRRTPFFEEVLRDAESARGDKSGIVLALPTGSGKTYITAVLIAEELGRGGRVLFLATTNVLVEQQFRVLSSLVDCTSAHFTSADSQINYSVKNYDLVFMTGHLIALRYNLIGVRSEFTLIVLDEIHNISPLSPYYVVLQDCSCSIIGLSASLGDSIDHIRSAYPLPIQIITKKQTHSQRFFKKIEVGISSCRLPNKLRLQEYIRQNLSKYKRLLTQFENNRLSISEVLELPNFALRIKLITGLVLLKYLTTQPCAVFNEFMGKHMSLARRLGLSTVFDEDPKTTAILRIMEAHPQEKFIVFAEFVTAVKEIAKALEKKGISTSVLLGKVNKISQKDSLLDFRSGTSRVLVCSRVGDEGLDIEEANMGVFFEPTNSSRKFIQRSGRIARSEGCVGSVYVCAVVDSIESVKLEAMQKMFRIEWTRG